ncbi:XdhC family protein [Halorussus marinus]|uniref:XdhC family protein n=1 Tax=Halorussus marinus TaxID=2505976 RepID=UPI001FCECFCB|nr:XdhC/CoxI family protein [Halorussus marinus]
MAGRRSRGPERAPGRLDADSPAVLATVAGAEGAAYRRPGAKRVVESDAARAGDTEDPLADLAAAALDDGPLARTFDLTADGGTLGRGLGYSGVVDLLVEPIDASVEPALDRIAAGERVAVVTVTGGDRAPVGARAIATPDGGVEAADARPPIPDDVLADVRPTAGDLAAAGESARITAETDRGTATVFVDGYAPATELLALAGDLDVRPVARFAREAGFRVTVATPTGTGIDAGDVPAAHRVLAIRPADLADAVGRPADTYAVLLSHDFEADRLALASLLDTDVPYVGVMGPRERFGALAEALAEDGRDLSDADRDRIASPVGLDLGSDDPAQVGLSVVAEALAVANGREGGRLTRGEGPIHPRPDV